MAASPVSFAPAPVPSSAGISFRIKIITVIATQRMPWQESTRTVTVLPLMTLADKTAVEGILKQSKGLADELKIDNARTCLSEYKKSLKKWVYLIIYG